MAAPKGKVQNPNGRPKGIPNQTTINARGAIAAFVEGNTNRLERLLDKIEAKDPAKAFDCIMSVVEYHIPKLARTEVKSEVQAKIEIGWKE